MKKLKFEIDINAPREKVWEALWQDAHYREWSAAFMPGSHAVSDWKEGSRIQFLGPDGSGMYSVIKEKTDNEYMAFQHVGEMKEFKELPVDAKAEQWSGGIEDYRLEDNNGGIKLKVSVDMGHEYEAEFNRMFPLALAKVKEIAERA